MWRRSPHLLSQFAQCGLCVFLQQQTIFIKEGWQEIQPLGLPTQGVSIKDKGFGVSPLLLHLWLFVEAVLHFPLLISSSDGFFFFFSPILFHFVINLTLTCTCIAAQKHRPSWSGWL